MSRLTPLKKIFALTSGDTWNPYMESSAQADSIEAALATVPSAVASEAERDALFGASPKQGSAAYRTDLGMVERYFAAYSQSSNPGGSVAGAGWYPESGRVPYFEVFAQPGRQVLPNATWTVVNTGWNQPTINRGFESFTGGVLRIKTSGIYIISCSWATALGVAVGNRATQLTNNTTAVDGVNTLNRLEVQGFGTNSSFPVQLKSGDELRMFVFGPAAGLCAYSSDTVLRVNYLSMF